MTKLLLLLLLFLSIGIRLPPVAAQSLKVNHDYSKLLAVQSLRIAFGSCVSTNKSEIWSAILERHPDMLILLGDNIYQEPSEFGNKTSILEHYNAQFAHPVLKKLIETVPNVEIWSDHDFGADNSDSSFKGSGASLAAFKQFWGSFPGAVLLDSTSLAASFSIGRVKFILTDDRSYRINQSAKSHGTVFGKKQLSWLKAQLSDDKAALTLVLSGGQLINSVENGESLRSYPREQQELLKMLAASPSKVIVLSGDRHYAEIIERNYSGKKLVELSSSPLTAGPIAEGSQPYENFRTAAVFGTNNFGLLNIDLSYNVPRVAVEFYDSKGKQLLERNY